MSEWVEKQLGEMVYMNPPVELVRGKAYPFIDIGRIECKSKIVSNAEIIEFNGQGGSRFQTGDTVFSRITPCLENRKIAQVRLINADRGFGSTEFFVFRNKTGLTDPLFVYYLVSSDWVVLPAINSMTGASGRQRADRGFVENLKIKFPPLPTQTRIADILSAYDDAIENNNRRIALLEKAARELYREWFVRFRFPGHERTRFVNGLSEGWEVKKLKEIAKINPPLYTTKNTNEEINYIDISSVNNGRFNGYTQYTASEAPSRARRKIEIYDTIYSTVRPSLRGYRFIVSCPLNPIASTGFAVIRSKKQYNSAFIYFLLTEQGVIDYFSQIATGTSYPAISGSDIENLKIVLPNENTLKIYWDNVQPILDKIDKCESQSQNLARQRDLLLPRLMSGKLEVG